jgi:sphinganine-1-phosphate aldolase
VSEFPYAEQFEVHRVLPEAGVERDEILETLRTISGENPVWEGGQCSGTMYCGDHDHYDFLNEAFASFSYVNALQRDMCPSATKFEAEIIAMTLDLLGRRRA